MNTKWKKLYFPLFWEVAFIIGTRLWSIYALYLYFLFFLGILVAYQDSFSMRAWLSLLRSGKKFWIPVFLTGAATYLAYQFKLKFPSLLPMVLDVGIIDIRTTGVVDMFLFAVTFMFMAPFAEELFLRAGLISFADKKKMVATTLLSLILNMLLYADGWVGMVSMALLFLPMTLCYVCTRNKYASLTVHLVYGARMSMR